MNEFYSISPLGMEPKDTYQLENLGPHVAGFSITALQRDGSIYDSTLYHPTTSEDYDNKFSFILSRTKPPYKIEGILNYHFNFYAEKGGSKENFIKHIQYVILPYFIKMKYGDVYVQLLNNWIDENSMKNRNNKFDIPSITGNNNFVNVADGNIHQSGITINVNESQYGELKDLGVDEKHISELREMVSNNEQDKPTLKGKILKWLSAVTVSVATKGLIDNLPKLQEFAHNLIP